MRDQARCLSGLTSEELGLIDRLATRYSRLVLDYARLTSLMVEECRIGDPVAVRAIREEASSLTGEISRCRIGLAVLHEELTSKVQRPSEPAPRIHVEPDAEVLQPAQ